jgi:hypothetical protein
MSITGPIDADSVPSEPAPESAQDGYSTSTSRASPCRWTA